jgi:ubiquinone/menaquinone biosynthesis C-methylase UbiE
MDSEYLHSADYFGDQRDFWWNRDFLELMVKRWQLSQASSLLDVGCGIGHWIRLLFPYLKAESKVFGIDQEQEWVEQSQIKFAQEYPQIPLNRYQFLKGNVYDLPFKDNYFDVVTCQTLIMHLSDPLKGLNEMLRVTKPGGILIFIEPENIFSAFNLNSLTTSYPVETVTKIFEFWWRYEKGKISLGEGNNSIGGLIPGLLSKLGLLNIKVYLSDKASPLFPPYNTEEQITLINQDKDWYDNSSGPWNYKDFKKKYLASGASEEEFNKHWNFMNALYKDYCKAVDNLSFCAGGGGLVYLISGRKP